MERQKTKTKTKLEETAHTTEEEPTQRAEFKTF